MENLPVGYLSCRSCGSIENCADLVSGLCPVCRRGRAAHLAQLQSDYQEALQAGCQVALYVLTHRAEVHEEDGVLVANPGSFRMPYTAQPPSYLRLTIAGDRVQPELIYLKNTKKKRLWL